MSGGVDSGVSAYLMKQNGYDCIAVTMKLFSNGDISLSEENSCCSTNDIDIAKNLANSLGMEHHLLNFSDDFKEKVIDNFVSSYENGATPNPCIECNRHLKFTRLFSFAEENGCDYIVTGHYARSDRDEESGRYLLKKAIDEEKDQSYVLYCLTQEQLAHTRFPLGQFASKDEIRAIAAEYGFVTAKASGTVTITASAEMMLDGYWEVTDAGDWVWHDPGMGTKTVSCTIHIVPSEDALYSYSAPVYEEFTLKLIPYSAFANRGVSNMMVWFRAE